MKKGQNFTPDQQLKVEYYNKPVYQYTAGTTTAYLAAQQDFTASADGTWVNTVYTQTGRPTGSSPAPPRTASTPPDRRRLSPGFSGGRSRRGLGRRRRERRPPSRR
ncbi:hypothetical protein GCM10009727_32040 [Actinomadura napierensis]|uniref:Uncharacterized protein n=1 Tax=Actinomadura napierensis TaxID=267854 RepID=A0ABP5KWF6_9ACTN